MDGTAYDPENELVKLSGISDCRSFDPNGNEIVDTEYCNSTLPFMCNKRNKPRDYIIETNQNGVTFNEAQTFCEDVYGTDLATVITEEEFSDILRMIPDLETAWIGIRNIGADNVVDFVWMDGNNCTDDLHQNENYTESICTPFWNETSLEISLMDQNVSDIDICGAVWQGGFIQAVDCYLTQKYFICNQPEIYIDISMSSTLDPFIFTSSEVDMTGLFQAGTAGFSDISNIPEGETPWIRIKMPYQDGSLAQSPNNDDTPVTLYWYTYQDLRMYQVMNLRSL